MYITYTENSQALGKALVKRLKGAVLPVERRQFADGERYLRLSVPDATTLAGEDVVVVGSTHTDEDLLEIYRLGCTLADMGTRRRIFVIPFFGYSTMDRSKRAGESVAAKHNARLLSSIPNSNEGNMFVLLDLHEPVLVHYFEGSTVAIEISAEAMLLAAIRKMKLKSFVLGSADLGMPRQVMSLAEKLNVPVALVSKAREFEHTQTLACVGNVHGNDVVMYDDMIRSGSSLIQAAEAYEEAGANNVYAVVSHLALTTENVLTQLKNSPLKAIITTNSHPMSQLKSVQKSKHITVLDISSVVANTIEKLIS
ncbi:MAG: ribose-phosphate pyrophosphokinase [Candidatus Andersenbacteria bacterium]|nr:ribose-phosphate pyrophosphokinase [Candidatus Andersenbacteria bacterium]MBI3250729.1 ribose-phosphate pyrophosphokinase [Candidatus Andersenbacteria bacterium]